MKMKIRRGKLSVQPGSVVGQNTQQEENNYQQQQLYSTINSTNNDIQIAISTTNPAEAPTGSNKNQFRVNNIALTQTHHSQQRPRDPRNLKAFGTQLIDPGVAVASGWSGRSSIVGQGPLQLHAKCLSMDDPAGRNQVAKGSTIDATGNTVSGEGHLQNGQQFNFGKRNQEKPKKLGTSATNEGSGLGDETQRTATKRDSFDLTMRNALGLCRPTNSQEEVQRSPLKEDFFSVTKIDRLQEIGNARQLDGVEERDMHWFRQRSSIPPYSHVNKVKLPSKHTTNSIFKQFEETKMTRKLLKIKMELEMFNRTTGQLGKAQRQRQENQSSVADSASKQVIMSHYGSMIMGPRESLQHSLCIQNCAIPIKYTKVGSEALRTGASQGSVGSNLSYESGGSQGVVMGRRKFNVKTADNSPNKKQLNSDLVQTIKFDPNLVLKASFDLGVTESLEKGSLSLNNKNINDQQAKINKQDFGNREGQNNDEVEKLEPTHNSQGKSKIEGDDMSQENPLNGYINLEQSQSKDSKDSKDNILSPTSKEVTLNPMLQTKFLNSSEPSNQLVLSGAEMQRSQEIHEINQKINLQNLDERLGSLSATPTKHHKTQANYRPSPKQADRTDKTEKTFRKEASIDGHVDFSIYTSKKDSRDHLQLISPHLHAKDHYVVPLVDDRQPSLFSNSLIFGQGIRGKHINSELRTSPYVGGLPPPILAGASRERDRNRGASGVKNAGAMKKYVNLPVKQLELSESSRFDSRMQEQQMQRREPQHAADAPHSSRRVQMEHMGRVKLNPALATAQGIKGGQERSTRGRRSNQSGKINYHSLNPQKLTHSIQRNNRHLNATQQVYHWPAILPSARSSIQNQAAQLTAPLAVFDPSLSLHQQKSSVDGMYSYNQKIVTNNTSGIPPRLAQNIEMQQQAGVFSSNGSLNLQQYSIIPNGQNLAQALGHSASSASRQNQPQGTDTRSSLDGVFNVQKLEPIIVATQYMPNAGQQQLQSVELRGPGGRFAQEKLPQIRASQNQGRGQGIAGFEVGPAGRQAGPMQPQMLHLIPASNHPFRTQQNFHRHAQPGVVDYNLMQHSPITKFCVMFVQKNNSNSPMVKTKSPSEHNYSLHERDGRKSTLSSLSRQRTSNLIQLAPTVEENEETAQQQTTIEAAPKTMYQTFSIESNAKNSNLNLNVEKQDGAVDKKSEGGKIETQPDATPLVEGKSRNQAISLETPKETQNWVTIPDPTTHSGQQQPIMISSENFGSAGDPATFPHSRIVIQRRGGTDLPANVSGGHVHHIHYIHGYSDPQSVRFIREENFVPGALGGVQRVKSFGRQGKKKKEEFSMTQVLNKLSKRIATEHSHSLSSQAAARNSNQKHHQNTKQAPKDQQRAPQPAAGDTQHIKSILQKSSGPQYKTEGTSPLYKIKEGRSSNRPSPDYESGRVSIHESSIPVNPETKSFFSFNRKIMNLDVHKSKHMSNFSIESFRDKTQNELNDYFQNLSRSKMTAANSIYASKQGSINSPLSTYCPSDKISKKKQNMNKIKLNLPSQKEMPMGEQQQYQAKLNAQSRAKHVVKGGFANVVDYIEDSVQSTPNDKLNCNQDTKIRTSVENSKTSLEHPVNIGIQQIRVIEGSASATNRSADSKQQRSPSKKQSPEKGKSILFQTNSPKLATYGEQMSLQNTENSCQNSSVERHSPLPSTLRQKYDMVSNLRGKRQGAEDSELRIERLRERLATGSPAVNRKKQQGDAKGGQSPAIAVQSQAKTNTHQKQSQQIGQVLLQKAGFRHFDGSNLLCADGSSVNNNAATSKLPLKLDSSSTYSKNESSNVLNHFRGLNQKSPPPPQLQFVFRNSTATPLNNQKNGMNGLIIMNHNSKLVYGPVYEEARDKNKWMKGKIASGSQSQKDRQTGEKRVLSIFLQRNNANNNASKDQATRQNTETSGIAVVGRQQDITGRLDSTSHPSNNLKPYNDSTQNIQLSRDKLNSIKALSDDSEDSKGNYEDSYLIKTASNSNNFKKNASNLQNS